MSGMAQQIPAARVRWKVWIEQSDKVLLSEWRVDLLRTVAQTGSLARAAAAMDVPYRTAWNRIKEMEAHLDIRLLETAIGGVDGGGSQLTAEAADLVERFQRVTAGVATLVEERFCAEFGDRLR